MDARCVHLILRRRMYLLYACFGLVLANSACRKHEPPLPHDAASPVDAAPPIDDAPPIDAAPPPAPPPTKLVAAGHSTCAGMSDTTVRGWGSNTHGQLGNGQTTDAASPVAPDIRAVVDLQLACALAGGAIACWGDRAPRSARRVRRHTLRAAP